MQTNPAPRSILDLSLDELEQVIATNELPPGVGLQGIEARKDFDKLFRHRLNPAHIATRLVRDKAKPLSPTQRESDEMKQARIDIRKLEVEAKHAKANQLTVMNERIIKKLDSIDSGMVLLASRLEAIQRQIDKLSPT
jgi:hypothetical protein